MNHSLDYFKSLFFPNRVESLVVPILSLGPATCAFTLTIVKYNFNDNVNRYTTLLTKIHNLILLTILASVPVVLIDILRFTSGIVLHSWICSFYSFYDCLIIEAFVQLITIEAFFHYLFVRKQKDEIFLVIKEDLLTIIIWRLVLVVGIGNNAYKFYNRHRMPKAYYICAGLEPVPDIKYCDSNQDHYQNFTTTLYIFIFSIFSFLMVIEKRKMTKYVQQDTGGRKNAGRMFGGFESGMNTERIVFLTKVTYAIQLMLLTGIYEQYDASLIQAYPGVLLVYWYHFFMLPVAVLFGIWISVRRNERLSSYMKRKLPWQFLNSRSEPS